MAAKFTARSPYLVLVALVFLADRWTKLLILENVDLHRSIPVIDGFFNITYVRNTGVAFGLLASLSSPLKSLLLSMFALAAVVVVVLYSLRNPATNRLLQGALALILGGALGNLYDRIRYGYVVDFLELYWRDFYWPAFNVADSAISVGVVLLAIEILRDEPSSRT